AHAHRLGLKAGRCAGQVGQAHEPGSTPKARNLKPALIVGRAAETVLAVGRTDLHDRAVNAPPAAVLDDTPDPRVEGRAARDGRVSWLVEDPRGEDQWLRRLGRRQSCLRRGRLWCL